MITVYFMECFFIYFIEYQKPKWKQSTKELDIHILFLHTKNNISELTGNSLPFPRCSWERIFGINVSIQHTDNTVFLEDSSDTSGMKRSQCGQIYSPVNIKVTRKKRISVSRHLFHSFHNFTDFFDNFNIACVFPKCN